LISNGNAQCGAYVNGNEEFEKNLKTTIKAKYKKENDKKKSTIQVSIMIKINY